MPEVLYAVEGVTDEPVAEKLIIASGCDPRRAFTAGGKPKLDPKIQGYNRSSAHLNWLVLRDLDLDDRRICIPDLLSGLIGGERRQGLMLRLAVRSVESWLMADSDALSAYFRITASKIPTSPDLLDHPKTALVNLCRKSKSKDIRSAMVPRPEGRRAVGSEYVATVRKYAADYWDIDRARRNSPSLARAIASAERMVVAGGWTG